MPVDGTKAIRIRESGFDFGSFRDDVPQWLGDGRNQEKSLACPGVPTVAETSEVVGLHGLAAIDGAAEAGEGDERIERAVIVREFLAGGDVADGEFEVVTEAQAIGVAGVVEVAAVIPAEDVTATGVDVGVFVEGGLRVGRESGDLLGVELLVEGVEGPDDGASRNESGGEDAPADVIVNETQFRVGVDHIVAWVCGAYSADAGARRGLAILIWNSVCNRAKGGTTNLHPATLWQSNGLYVEVIG